MKEQLRVQLDLGLLFDPSSHHSLATKSIVLSAQFTHCEEGAHCALIGRPRFEGEAKVKADAAGPAAGFLDCWLRYGSDAPGHVRGGFAAVVVDVARRAVFLAVDRFSIETLCFRVDEHSFAASDRADRVPGRGSVLDPQAIFDYLYFHSIPAPRTIFSDVSRVPAAHGILIDRNGVHEARHWSLDFRETERPRFGTARREFLDLIRHAIGEEIEGETKVGAFLSGGTDSSTVAGVLGQLSGLPAPAYSIGFEAEGYDEMAYARLAAKHFGCEHHEYYVTPADLLESIPAVARHHDQPFGNSSALPAYYCARLAKNDGCSKLLAGDGGDELFGGNSRYATQRLFEFYQAVPGALRRAIEPMCTEDSPLRRIPGLRQAAGYVRHSRIPMPDRAQAFNLLMRLDPSKVLSAGFLARIDSAEPVRHMRETWQDCDANSLINRMLAFDWRYTLADSDLPKVRGATTMAGVGVGYPLLDDRLADFSMTLPPNWKLRRFKLRWFFKEALAGFLPDEIIKKKKHGFGLPFGVWMMKHTPLHDLAKGSLYKLVDRGLLRREFVVELFTHRLNEHAGYYGEMVWILMMLEQWLSAQDPSIEIG